MIRTSPLSRRLGKPGRAAVLPGALVVLFAAGCPQPVGTRAASGDAAAPQPSAASALSAERDCQDVSLSLPADAVVATVDGEEVTAAALGPELKQAEDQALRSYCESVAEARRIALDNHVNEQLLERAAQAAGQTPEEYVRGRVEAAAERPDDAALRAFYDENKSAAAPPFEDVKMQVAIALQRQAAEQAIEVLIQDLRRDAEVVDKLPSVRPPALDVDIPAHTAAAGPEDARVEVVEFADFECPYCSRAADAMSAVKERYKDRVRFAYRHFPLSFHPNAKKAAEYAQCAEDQGKFWAFHDLAYDNQQALDEASLRGYAEQVGMSMEAVDTCLTTGEAAAEVEADMLKARELGVEGTPTFYINGRPFKGNATPSALAEAIEAELAAGS